MGKSLKVQNNTELTFHEDEGQVFVEGKIGELNHFSTGFSIHEAMANYYRTLGLTLDAHVKAYGNVNKIFPDLRF